MPIISRLTYSNVVATLALFLALGGVSYAALTLPAHSVGKRQLRVGAVTPPALGFPLGASGFASENEYKLARNLCNSPGPPGQPVPPCVSSIFLGDLVGPRLHIATHSPGKLEIFAQVGVRYRPADGDAHADATISLDRKAIATAYLSIDAGHSAVIPAQALVNVSPGRHTIELRAAATYESRGTNVVIASPVSLIVNLLPNA